MAITVIRVMAAVIINNSHNNNNNKLTKVGLINFHLEAELPPVALPLFLPQGHRGAGRADAVGLGSQLFTEP